MKETNLPTTLVEAVTFFGDEERSFEYIVGLRWPDGVKCPHCGHDEHSFLSTRRTWKCKGCGKQFSVKKGTIFEDSPLKIGKWMVALWLIVNARNGISSHELGRSIGVTQKTAWFMLHRIRLAMQTGNFQKFTGTVEADETYVGGKAKNMHAGKRAAKVQGRGAVGKAAVIGFLDRDARKVRAMPIADVARETIHAHVRSTVECGANLYTDENRSYLGLGRDYRHRAINHAIRYVDGDVHTNGLENFWSLLKRSIKGTYIGVSPEHLLRYVDEQAFRYNFRSTDDAGRALLAVASTPGKRITYRQLISARASLKA